MFCTAMPGFFSSLDSDISYVLRAQYKPKLQIPAASTKKTTLVPLGRKYANDPPITRTNTMSMAIRRYVFVNQAASSFLSAGRYASDLYAHCHATMARKTKSAAAAMK
jgi:hypothetical protein